MARMDWSRMLVLAPILMVSAVAVADEEASAASISNALSSAKEDGRRVLTIAKIKTLFADRKDITGRYIRIRYDGHVLQLAGFVPNKEAAKAAEEIAREAASPEVLQTFWAYDEAIDNREPRKTYIGEQASDMLLNAKVLASLNGPDVRPLFKDADIVHVNVTHGKVTVYIVADAPPGTFDLAPHIKPIAGVTGFSYRVARTYTQQPPSADAI